MTNYHILTIAKQALEELKAIDIYQIDVRDKTSITDYMLIASGTSNRQVKALAENIIEQAKTYGFKTLGTEGIENGEWALVDFGNLIVHVMQPETRKFYDLEHLWQGVTNLYQQ